MAEEDDGSNPRSIDLDAMGSTCMLLAEAEEEGDSGWNQLKWAEIGTEVADLLEDDETIRGDIDSLGLISEENEDGDDGEQSGLSEEDGEIDFKVVWPRPSEQGEN